QIDARAHTYNTALNQIVLGAEIDGNPHVDMQVAAVLVYDRALSAAEQVQVQQYLQGKYFEGGGSDQPPVANDDSASVVSGGTVSIDVLTNDSDPDGTLDASTVLVTRDPS